MPDTAPAFPESRDVQRLTLDQLLARRSVGPLQEPAPDGADLDLILDAGLRAPDHGKLRPWRFVVIRGDARLAFGERLAEAAAKRDPANGAALGERYRAWVRRIPMLIAVGAIVKGGNIPEIEQVLSAGAAAMNMLNAIHLLGFGGMWVTGANVYDPSVNALLGFEAPSHLVGFLTVGTPATSLPSLTRPDRTDHVVEWVDPS
ncbi:nitroreductase [Reyranella sp.]|uniref:nitroreductase family protein n=1 Tax=Reyranella sp. TaxID=1929291 RepID=UPI001201C60E|nr:nitroreductase [Reyranella sp.]TAJ84299.1 MAG: nitroreductase [Reyranella sp.]